MKFKSQICTTAEQSKRLLGLGLKPETADMSDDGWNDPVVSWGMEWSKEVIESGRLPAWSLHRLIEMALRYVLICGISFTFNEDAYEKVIGIIEHQIKEGYFPKKYLVDLTGRDSSQDMVDAVGYAMMAIKKEE